MITNVLGKVGLPILMKFVTSGLAKIDAETAKDAVKALSNVSSEIKADKISGQQLTEANRHAEREQEIESEYDSKTLSVINETIRQELTSEDRFVRFWRPTFGYSVALAWFLNMGTICYVVLADYDNAPEIIMSLVETTSLWSVALGVLGVSVVKRSQEKQSRRGDNAVSRIINKIT